MTSTTTRRTALHALLATPLALRIAAPAAAQGNYPNKTIRLVVGYPAGQTVDTIARNYAAAISKELGQVVYVDNRAGANGILGAQEVKRAAPDGYTVLFATSGQMAINPALYKTLPYDVNKDFTPVSLVGTGPVYLVANPEFPASNVQELVAYAKANPGKVNYGSGGIGITAHLAMELFQQQAGVKLTHVPYKGSPAALQDLIGGRIQLMFEAGASILPHVASGKVKILGSSARKRNAQLPNIPTVDEQGIKGFEVTSWTGVFVPAGTPEPIVAALNTAIRHAGTVPAIQESSRTTGTETVGSTQAQFNSFLQMELKKWAKAVTDGNVQVE